MYILLNLWRNLSNRSAAPLVERFYIAHPFSTPGIASASRILTKAHIKSWLPELLPPKSIRVLEIGCGSGRLCSILSDIVYSGEYVGLDIDDRFMHTEAPSRRRAFIFGEAHAYDPVNEKFDLIISVSALEYIPRGPQLIERLPSWLTPDGIEIHFLPYPSSLLIY